MRAAAASWTPTPAAYTSLANYVHRAPPPAATFDCTSTTPCRESPPTWSFRAAQMQARTNRPAWRGDAGRLGAGWSDTRLDGRALQSPRATYTSRFSKHLFQAIANTTERRTTCVRVANKTRRRRRKVVVCEFTKFDDLPSEPFRGDGFENHPLGSACDAYVDSMKPKSFPALFRSVTAIAHCGTRRCAATRAIKTICRRQRSRKRKSTKSRI